MIRFAQEGHLRGIFALTSYDQPPALYGGIPTLATPRVDTVQQAITYLNRIPLERRFAAICLNARTLGPADAAHIAAHVASRYVAVPPAELMALLLSAALPTTGGEPGVTVTSAEHPEGAIAPTTPVAINAEIVPTDQVFAASVVYRSPSSRVAFNQTMWPGRQGVARPELPPLRWGGAVEMKIRGVDRGGRVAWSPLWTLQVNRQDADGDGVSDTEEAFLLTNPQFPDTDGDGTDRPERPQARGLLAPSLPVLRPALAPQRSSLPHRPCRFTGPTGRPRPLPGAERQLLATGHLPPLGWLESW